MAARRPITGDAPAVTLERLEDAYVDIQIEGLTPYIPHRWSEKALRTMPGHPNAPSIKEKKGPHEPEAEAEACVYRLSDGRPGIPATGLKAAMVGACRFFRDVAMVEAKSVIHVVGEGSDQLIPFEGTPILREDTPRNSGGSADLRYRYAFENWRATVRVRFIPSVLTPSSIVALLDAAGRLGIGDWRPSAPKSATGTYGTWRVVVREKEA